MKKYFTENDIRPRDLIEGQRKALLNDVEFLKRHMDDFVNVNCPACNASLFKNKYFKYGFQIVECKNCSTNYTNPRPTAELLADFYDKSESYAYWNKYIFPASEEVRREKIFKKRVDEIINYCDKYLKSKNSILEVGAGYGTFCEELLTRNIFERIVGVEPTPSLAETCRNKGIEVINKPVELIDLSEDQRFDVVVNFEVIEHLFSPREFILQCKKLLKDNGLFILTCPNGQGFDVITLKEISNTIDHEHLNYFNPDSIKLLLEECGFEILDLTTPGVLDADIVRNSVLDGQFSLEDYPFLKKILIEKWDEKGESFQKYLIENKMSSNMWVVAKKN